MLRRVTALAALGDPSVSASAFASEAAVSRHPAGVPFTDFNRRRTRSSACSRLVGLSWNFDPPATDQQEDKLVPYDFDQKSLDA